MIYLDGELLAPDRARIDPTDRGFLLADGLFETLAVQDGRPLDLAEHLARLTAGAAVLDLPLPALDIATACAETLAANRLTEGRSALRITLTRGPGPRGLPPPETPRPSLMITAVASPASSRDPIRVIHSTIRRNEHSPLSRLKSLAYLDNVLARQEAARQGADDALLCNTVGNLACASAANLFLVMGGRLLTPPLSDGVLPGILRAKLLDQARATGLDVEERSLSPDDLAVAEEAFLTNSLIGLRPIGAVEGRSLAAPGPVATRLQSNLM